MKRLLSLVIIGAALAGHAHAQSLTKLRVAYDGYSMTSAPLYYADHEGIFKKFGLDVQPAFVEGGSLLTQAVVGGSIDIAQNGYTPAAGAAVQGADIVFIGGISNKLPFQLVVKASIKGAADLKGQSIAISRYGSSTDTAADFALAHLGLTRNDVSVRQLGGPATRNAALISGQVAGTMEQYPDTGQLEQQGFHVLVDVTDIAGDYPNTSYATSRTFLKNNPDAVKRFFMAMATAVHEYGGLLAGDEGDDCGTRTAEETRYLIHRSVLLRSGAGLMQGSEVSECRQRVDISETSNQFHVVVVRTIYPKGLFRLICGSKKLSAMGDIYDRVLGPVNDQNGTVDLPDLSQIVESIER